MTGRWTWVACLFLIGCFNGPNDKPTLSPVSGKVTLDGVPLSSGIVIFAPDASQGTSGPSATGGIGEDGTFQLHTTEPGDGAAVGFHRVSIEAYSQAVESDPENPQMPIRKPLIPVRYMDATTSGLTAEVKQGTDNTFTFDLKSKP